MKAIARTFAAAALLAALFGVNGRADEATSANDIIIGVIAPMTGPSAAYGQQIRDAAYLWSNIVNKSGGVLQRKIRIIVADNQGTEAGATSATNWMVAQNPAVVMGQAFSGPTLVGSKILCENGIPSVANANADGLTKDLPCAVRSLASNDDAAKLASDEIARRTKDNSGPVYILDDGSYFGRELASDVGKHISGNLKTRVHRNTIVPGEKDFSAIVTEMTANHVALVFFAMDRTPVALILREFDKRKDPPAFVGTSILTFNDFAQGVASKIIERGTIISLHPANPDIQKTDPIYLAAKEQHFDVDDGVRTTISALQIAAGAIALAGSTDHAVLIKTMHSDNFHAETLIGTLNFDQYGNIISQLLAPSHWVELHNRDGSVAGYSRQPGLPTLDP